MRVPALAAAPPIAHGSGLDELAVFLAPILLYWGYRAIRTMRERRRDDANRSPDGGADGRPPLDS